MNQEEFQDVEIPREQQLRALTVIDKYALDFDDKILLAQILGIAPSRSGGKCRECGHTMSGTDFVNHVRPGADRYCAGCYRARSKQRKAQENPRKLTEPPRDRAAGHCVQCGVEMGRRRDLSWKGAFYGGRNRCDRCYSRLLRAERKEAK